MERSLPKFGDRCTINRAILRLGVGVGVEAGRASARDVHAAMAIVATQIQVLAKLFLTELNLTVSLNFSQSRAKCRKISITAEHCFESEKGRGNKVFLRLEMFT